MEQPITKADTVTTKLENIEKAFKRWGYLIVKIAVFGIVFVILVVKLWNMVW